ncbi:MAG: ATP-binding cassette domain-containing protein [Dermatophilus congolensis]|nr:ATP-binding cassette domain-containing protein [Dermatophilus congolensis]
MSTNGGQALRALRAEGVTAGYGRRNGPRRGWADAPARPGGRLVLDGVSLDIPAGTTVGLTGPSGTGKSTLARVLTGLLTPESGQVTMDGVPLSIRRGRLGGDVLMIFQSPRRSCSPNQTLRQIVATPMTYPSSRVHTRDASVRAAAVSDACERVGLTDDLLDRLPGEVSLGQLQRAVLAGALVARPRYLVCDEATAMLDAVTTAGVVDVLRAAAATGVGVLAISHDTDLLGAWADTVHDLRELGG